MPTRRDAIKQIAVALTAASVMGAQGCVKFRSETDYEQCGRDITLRSFIDAVVPGADVSHPAITTAFHDKLSGFPRYRLMFVLDVRKRSMRMFGTWKFHTLDRNRRVEVIRNGLSSGNRKAQLYSAAVLLAQVSAYTGFYQVPEGSSVIDFSVAYDHSPVSDGDYNSICGRSLTSSGNLA